MCVCALCVKERVRECEDMCVDVQADCCSTHPKSGKCDNTHRASVYFHIRLCTQAFELTIASKDLEAEIKCNDVKRRELRGFMLLEMQKQSVYSKVNMEQNLFLHLCIIICELLSTYTVFIMSNFYLKG